MKDKTSSLRNRWVPSLTLVQHATAPFISVFLAIHLAAPISALVGGSSTASNVMLLGREYYQTPSTEPLLVWLPIGLHVGASLVKRALIGLPSKLNTLQSTSLALAWVLVPIHASVHRFIPSSPAPPISGLSPSELDYEYVKAGLHQWPLTSWALYTLLVGSMVIHALEGSIVIYRKWLHRPRPFGDGERSWIRYTPSAIATAVALSVLGGIKVLSSEASYASRGLASRIEVSYIQSFLFRWTAR